MKEGGLTLDQRVELAVLTSDAFPDFLEFVEAAFPYIVPDFNGLSKVQRSMCQFLQSGPRLRMLQAQRGEGKTYITATYCVWRLVHDPSLSILVVPSVADKGDDIVRLITKLIMSWDMLEYLRPDKAWGDLKGATKFDVYGGFRRLAKDPSITLAPILGSLPGRRPSLILADDIETLDNACTAGKRETILSRSKEFTRMCTHGDIIYLGTPQTKDSVYNTLPARGFAVRIWPGRYPAAGEDKYGEFLSPDLRKEMEDDPSLRVGGGLQGNMGKPTDPLRFDEEALIEKEIDGGPEDFALNYMLDTTLSDELRLQLKLKDLMFIDCAQDYIPTGIHYLADPKKVVPVPPDFPVRGASIYWGEVYTIGEFKRPDVVWCTIDTAGEGGDETVLCAGTAVGDNIHVLDMLAVQGGLKDSNVNPILSFLRINKVTNILVETNMGHGLFELALRNMLQGTDLEHLSASIKSEYNTKQKERRIINDVRPILERHKLVVHKKVLDWDHSSLRGYPVGTRNQFSLFYQLANITTDRQSLPHDDRIDCFSMLVRVLSPTIMNDPLKEAEERENRKVRRWLENPLGEEYSWIEFTDQPHRPTVWG